MDFRIAGDGFYKNGKPIKIISGAVHYFRNMPGTWDDIFEKAVACGLNCVETYCAWNMHEKTKGKFDFSNNLDIVSFIKKAQAHGLMVIVRPGPYICAEWEFGGLPWWLMTENDLEIRCLNDKYIFYFERYLSELFSRITPLLCTNGGPIIMMQVENEYGLYGDDKDYLKKLVKTYRELGVNVELFTSDGHYKNTLLDGYVDGCLPTINFGSDPEGRFAVRDELFPNTPRMCMEMWNGWFDTWGDDFHHTTSAENYSATVDKMLEMGSLNMYMFIGGTNFGFSSGANHNEKFMPTVTSYDYDALLTECGDVTEKYFAIRKVIQKHTDAVLPSVPKNRKKFVYGKVYFSEKAKLFDNINKISNAVVSKVPKAMEYYGYGYGYTCYQTVLKRDYENACLSFETIGDRALIYIGENCIGNVYINEPPYRIEFSAKKGEVLTILCENMGRCNFGPKMMRKKGIDGRLLIDNVIHFGWNVFPLPMTNLNELQFNSFEVEKNGVCENAAHSGLHDYSSSYSPSFYKAKFVINENPLDTFLKTDNFKKGFVIINGFNLGRYWEVGPQKTLYVPSCVLKRGENEIVLFESDGIKGEPCIEFTNAPDLGKPSNA